MSGKTGDTCLGHAVGLGRLRAAVRGGLERVRQLREDAVARRGQRDGPGVQPPRLSVPDPLQRCVDGWVPLRAQRGTLNKVSEMCFGLPREGFAAGPGRPWSRRRRC